MLAINGKIFVQPLSGLGRCAFELTKRFIAMGIPLKVIIPKRPLDAAYQELLPYIQMDSVSMNIFVWQFIRLPRILNTHQFEALWSPANVGPIKTNISHYLTLHDLLFLHDPKWFPGISRFIHRFVTPLICANAEKIICSCATVASEIQTVYPTLADKISYVYLGADHSKVRMSEAHEFSKSHIPYFVMLGNIELRKNFLGVKAAWQLAKHQLPKKAKLKLIGVKKRREDFDIELADDSIELMGRLSDEMTEALIKNATGLLYPSFYEGFGFPILEAMKLGCPVITSNFGAMAEIAGNAALLVDPASTQSIVDGIVRLTSSKAMYNDLKQRGLKRAEDFKWADTANSYIRSLNLSRH